MKKATLSGIRLSIDACFLIALAWGFGWLFCIVTGVLLLFDHIPLFDQIITTNAIPYWGIWLFPLPIGLIMSIIFTFILIKFHPIIDNYILICTFLVILPTLPFLKTTLSALKRSDELGILCFAYIALGILLSSFIFQRFKSISNVSSTTS